MPEERDRIESAPAPWPAPVRLAVHALLAGLLAVLLAGVRLWIERNASGLQMASPARVLSALRTEYLETEGGRRLLADALCAWPWVLAAFSRAGRLGSMRRRGGALSRILVLTGLAVFFNLFGQAVRLGGGTDEDSIRTVLAGTVAAVPPYLALLPVLILATRLPTAAAGAFGLGLLAFAVARVAVPDMFSWRPVVDAASGKVFIFPPTVEQRIDLFTPMLALWGIFTALELRTEARRRGGEPPDRAASDAA
jgi:hypothetical protein